jgi:hypothetical protein
MFPFFVFLQRPRKPLSLLKSAKAAAGRSKIEDEPARRITFEPLVAKSAEPAYPAGLEAKAKRELKVAPERNPLSRNATGFGVENSANHANSTKNVKNAAVEDPVAAFKSIFSSTGSNPDLVAKAVRKPAKTPQKTPLSASTGITAQTPDWNFDVGMGKTRSALSGTVLDGGTNDRPRDKGKDALGTLLSAGTTKPLDFGGNDANPFSLF